MSRVSLDFLARRLRADPVEWHCRANHEHISGADLYPLAQRTSHVRVPEFSEQCLKQDMATIQGRRVLVCLSWCTPQALNY